VKLFYPDLYGAVIPYNITVNLGLIIGFIASMFMSILLSQEKTVLHMTIQCVWGLCYIAAAYFFIAKLGLWGLIWVTLAANSIKLIVAILCVFLSKKNTSDT
jgi:Na+-driven multidrug efflux pump